MSDRKIELEIRADTSQVRRGLAVAQEDVLWMDMSAKLNAKRLLFQARVATTRGLRRRWWRLRHWAKVQEIALERKLHEERRREAAR